MELIKNVNIKKQLKREVLTKEKVNERMAHKGIELISDYTKSVDKHLFRCSKGHEWESRPVHVMRHIGCPHCSGMVELTTISINERLRSKGIKIISEFKTCAHSASFECKLGHRWTAPSGNVIQKGICPICSKYNPESVIKRWKESLKKLGLSALEDYKTAKTKIWVVCKNNHKYLVAPDSIVHGSGCNECANLERGFKPNKKGYLYLILLKKTNGEEGLGFGITNNIEYRTNQHRILLAREKIEWELIKFFEFENGADARRIESALKKHPEIIDFGVYCFRSECLPIYLKNYVFDFIQKESLANIAHSTLVQAVSVQLVKNSL